MDIASIRAADKIGLIALFWIIENRFRCVACTLMVAAAVFISACSDSRQGIVGKWVSDQSGFVTLQFYKDGTASLSSAGFLNLRWQMEEAGLVRIEALDRKVYFNFRLRSDQKGAYGALDLAGFDIFTFRKT